MFKTLVSEAGLESPFNEKALEKVADATLKELKRLKAKIR